MSAKVVLHITAGELRGRNSAALEAPGRPAQAPGTTEDEPHWDNRGHSFAAAAEAMRRILVENARRKGRRKRGGGLTRRDLDAAEQVTAPEVREDLLPLDEALTNLASMDPRAAQLVQLRYFAGLSIPDAARTLGVSPRTADRLWAFARVWLLREVGGDVPDG
jgi:RNA polymerase sigma factor (TIGR02999 family)